MSFVRNLLLDLVQFLDEPRVIYDRDGVSPYLSRWYLIREKPSDDEALKGQSSSDYNADGTPNAAVKARPFDLYLHRFHRSDDDAALHNHPWEWAVSFVLSGGYTEERREGDKVIRRIVRPFSFNFIRGEDFHRVDLVDHDAWSLFLVGRKVDTWYFWDRDRKARMQWRKFIRVKRDNVEPEWEPDQREVADGRDVRD